MDLAPQVFFYAYSEGKVKGQPEHMFDSQKYFGASASAVNELECRSIIVEPSLF